MRKIILITLLLVLISAVAAQGLEDQVAVMAAEAEGQILEGPLATLFGDQRLNIYIDLENGEQFILGLVTENKVVKSLEAGAVSKPTLKIYTTEAIVAKIQTSDDGGRVLKDALDSGEITYEAIGFFNKIKFGTISMVVNVIDYFTGEKDEEEVIVAEEEDDPEEEEVVPEEETPEPEVEDEEAEEEVETAPPAEPEITTHTIEMDNDGFEEDSITINVGETVSWKNVRTGTLKTAMVIGTQSCRNAKSGIFNNGETYSYTFDEAMTCTIVDGILTTTSMKVIVE